MTKNRLYCGDNLEILATMEKESVDLIYIDPPFFSNRHYEIIWGDEAEIRSFEDRWEGGINVYVDWMPGQTEFGCCIHGQIDGKHIAFTGDNIFGNPSDPKQTGHEAVVARNSAIFEEGYIYAAEYLHKTQPDIIVAGHSWVLNNSRKMIERFGRWAFQIRDVFKGLSAEPDYRYMFDPYWVQAQPYRAIARPGETVEVTVHLHNFLDRDQKYEINVCAPAQITAEPSVLPGRVPRESTIQLSLRLTAPADTKPGVHIIAFDTMLDGRRYGQMFDMVLCLEK